MHNLTFLIKELMRGILMAKSKAGKTNVGIWIDHRKAIVMTIPEKGEELMLTISGVEKHLSRKGDSPLKGSFEPQKVPADDTQHRAFVGQLNIYYDTIIASINHANSIVIYGPGLAKNELKKRLEKKKLGGIIVGFETADKMTNPQFAAKVRKAYS